MNHFTTVRICGKDWMGLVFSSAIPSWDKLVMILMYVMPILVMLVEVMGPSLDMTDTKLLT